MQSLGADVTAISELPPIDQVPYPGGDDPVVPFTSAAERGKPPRRKKGGLQEKILPPELDGEGPDSNDTYRNKLNDTSMVFSPQALGFIPANYWININSTFGDLVTRFFQRKNNSNCRFPHKLYNALTLVEHKPELYHLLGVKWVTNRVFMVDKLIFGRLLGISTIDGGLFHRQGNFPSHNFAEVGMDEAAQLKTQFGLDCVDMDRVRLMYHRCGVFYKGSSEDSVTKCKWRTPDEMTH